jgi:hypothetical protein
MRVGAMVGAGIFALLGAAGEVAGAAVWLSFCSPARSPPCRATRSPNSVPGNRRRSVMVANSAPPKSILGLLLVLYSAWTGQVLGNAVFAAT